MAKPSAKRSYVRTDYERKVVRVAQVCRRLEGGENVTEICRDPTMPGRSTLMAWAARHEELKAQMEAAEALVPARRRAYHFYSEAIVAEFLARIEDGRGLREVCAEPDMPAHCSITRWLNERPEFAERYRRAREAQADRLFDLAWRIACEAEPRDVEVARLKINTIKWRIGRLVPRKYGPWKVLAAPAGGAARPGPAAEADAEGANRDVLFEVRRFAYAPDGVKDITCLIRGLDAEAVAALRADIKAGRVDVPDDAVLAADETIEGGFILKGGQA